MLEMADGTREADHEHAGKMATNVLRNVCSMKYVVQQEMQMQG